MVAASFVLVETLVVVLLKQVVPVTGFGVLFVLGVLVVSTAWGLGLALPMAVVSALALGYFRNWPHGRFEPISPQAIVDVAVFLVAALLANFVARLARARGIEAERTTAELQESRDRLSVLAEQQAALRRVATLVARGASPSEVFAAVADEMGRCLNAAGAAVSRYDGDAIVLVGIAPLPADFMGRARFGERFPLDGDNAYTKALRTGLPARTDSLESATGAIAEHLRALGIQSMVAVPIMVGGRVWGTATTGSIGPEPLAPDTEARIADFADLVATAIANAATRDRLGELAGQQAALRRVATLVARAVDPAELFQAVADEMAHCIHVDNAAVLRYEPDGAVIVVSGHYEPRLHKQSPVGERYSLEGDNVAARVFDTARAARMDTHDNAPGALADRTRELGLRCAVAVPIVVDGALWGLATVAASKPEPLPADTEERLGDFADLLATAIGNAAARDDLIASRARIVAAADDARRRVERDLHDGAQQRLVSLGLQARLAESSVLPEQAQLKKRICDLASGLAGVSTELQEISRGIHPAILSEGGLAPALKSLARRCPVPVDIHFAVEQRLPDPVEVAAYYVVAEALTNAAKYAQASEVTLRAEAKGANLYVSIQDDGIGGADTRKGSGLVGLKDRVEVLGGNMHIASPPGNGTSLHITIPLRNRSGRSNALR